MLPGRIRLFSWNVFLFCQTWRHLNWRIKHLSRRTMTPLTSFRSTQFVASIRIGRRTAATPVCLCNLLVAALLCGCHMQWAQLFTAVYLAACKIKDCYILLSYKNLHLIRSMNISRQPFVVFQPFISQDRFRLYESFKVSVYFTLHWRYSWWFSTSVHSLETIDCSKCGEWLAVIANCICIRVPQCTCNAVPAQQERSVDLLRTV